MPLMFYALASNDPGVAGQRFICQFNSIAEIHQIDATVDPAVMTFIGRLPMGDDYYDADPGNNFPATPLNPPATYRNPFVPAPGTPGPDQNTYRWNWRSLAAYAGRLYVIMDTTGFSNPNDNPGRNCIYSLDPATVRCFGRVIMQPKDQAMNDTNGLSYVGALKVTGNMVGICFSADGASIYIAIYSEGFALDFGTGRVLLGEPVNPGNVGQTYNGLFRYDVATDETYYLGRVTTTVGGARVDLNNLGPLSIEPSTGDLYALCDSPGGEACCRIAAADLAAAPDLATFVLDSQPVQMDPWQPTGIAFGPDPQDGSLADLYGTYGENGFFVGDGNTNPGTFTFQPVDANKPRITWFTQLAMMP